MLFLTDKDYKIINNKFADLWEEVQGLKRRIRGLEDAKDEERCDDLSDIRVSDRVMVKHPKKGWVEGCVMEKCLCAAFVVSDGECIWTDKVRKIEK